jgi:DNA-directed RNA polymerase specialized sigma24 family protein
MAAQNITQLLVAWAQGDRAALESLTPLVYQELLRIARRHMAGERPGHTLHATALVNEAYVRLIEQDAHWQNRAHFFGVAAQTMRHILVDLDDALTDLEAFDPRKCRVVEMRFFGGLSLEEVADVLQVSVTTVRRDWSLARAWLHRELSRRD